MRPDYERAEVALFQEWDSLLERLFQTADRPADAPLDLDEKAIDSGQVRGYRSRVGKDLQAFHEKLSNIMESEKSGQ